MKDKFFEYHLPSKADFGKLWADAIISFDANVLLDLYRYSIPSREELLRLMRERKERIWVSYQAAYEFHKNRIEVIDNAAHRSASFIDGIKGAKRYLESDLRQHPFITEGMIAKVSAGLTEIVREFDEAQSAYPNFMSDDPIGQGLLEILDGRVGSDFSASEKQKLSLEIDQRYLEQVPPGYKDSKNLLLTNMVIASCGFSS